MNGVSGLNGLVGYQHEIDADAQATPEQRSGGPADPRHGNWGEQAAPYPWESSLGMGGSHGPYGVENELLGDEWWLTTPADTPENDPTFDATPATGAAPFPKGIASGPIPGETPDHIANQLEQSAVIHGINMGASRRRQRPPTGYVQNDQWTEYYDVDSGHSDLMPLPKQAMSSGFMWGTTDRTQSMARQNGYGFDSHHLHRREASGSIPGNYMWLQPAGRPLVKSLPGPANPPIGPDSPFAGQDVGQTFSIDGAILQSQPTEYVPPAQPYIAPALTSAGADAVVEWY